MAALLQSLERWLRGAETNAAERLGDFTATTRLIPISLAAIGIGYLSAWLALALLRLIGLFTNLFFFPGLTRFPVVDRRDGRFLGVVALFDLLQARVRNLEAERRRERVLAVRAWRRPASRAGAATTRTTLPPPVA